MTDPTTTPEVTAEVVDHVDACGAAAPAESIVDAVFDVATAWAAVGLDKARVALQKSADSLARTATRLGRVAEEIQPKRAA